MSDPLTTFLTGIFLTNPMPVEHNIKLNKPIKYTSYSLQGIKEPLATKIRQIQSNCGSVIISGVRHTKVKGTRKFSLHASGNAVDLRGNPSCIYANLKNWQGGYTTDYKSVNHVHISYGGSEHGLRFVHYNHHNHRKNSRIRFAELKN